MSRYETGHENMIDWTYIIYNNPPMSTLTSLLIIIISARVLAGLAERYNQPAILGQMLAGILLGPTAFNLIGSSQALSGISDLAVFLIVFSAGLEMDLKEVSRLLRGKGLLATIIGFALPFAVGILIGFWLNFDILRTFFLGLCVSITAIPVAIGILTNLNLLNTRLAHLTIATAIVNDVLALLFLGVLIALPEQKTWETILSSVFFSSIKLCAFVLIVYFSNLGILTAQKKGLPIQVIPEKLIKLFGQDALFGITIAFVLTFGLFSEALGFHSIIGCFFGALLLRRDFFMAPRYIELQKNINSISSGFLTPVFFAYIGLQFNIFSIDSTEMVLLIIFGSIISKILAGWLSGQLMGFSKPESWGLGIMLNGRGVMEIVIATIALEKQFIGQGLYTALVLMGLFTSIITPLLLEFIPGGRESLIKSSVKT